MMIYYFDDITYKNYKEVERQYKMKNSEFEFHVRGVVDFHADGINTLEFKIHEVNRDFNVCKNNLKSYNNFPSYIGGELNFSQNRISSLVGIHNTVKSCTEIDLSDNPIVEGGIGLLLIENLIKIWCAVKVSDEASCLAFRIIEKYLGQGKSGILECQEELIDNNLKEYAKL